MAKNNKYQKKNRSRLFGGLVGLCLAGATLSTGIAGLASEKARMFIADTAKKAVDKNTYIQAFDDVVGWGQSIVDNLKGKGISANIPAGVTDENVQDSEIPADVQSNSETTTGVTQSNTNASTAGAVENNQNVGNEVDSIAKNIAESAHDNSQKLGETDLINKSNEQLKSDIYKKVQELLQGNSSLSRFSTQFDTIDEVKSIMEKTLAEKNGETSTITTPSLYDYKNFSDEISTNKEFNKAINIAISNYSMLNSVEQKTENDKTGDITPIEEIESDIERETPDQGTYVQAYDTQRSQVKVGLAGALVGVGLASFAVFELLKRRLAKGSEARKSETRFYMGQRNVRSAEKLSRIEQEIDSRNKKIRSLKEKNVRSNNKINNSVRDLKIQTQLKKIAKLEKKESKLEEKCYRASKYSADKNKETNYKYLKRYTSRAFNLELNSFVNRVRGKKRRTFFNNESRLGLETYANVLKAGNYFAKYKISNKSRDLKKLIKHLNNLSEQQRKLIFDPHVYFAESIDMKGFQQKEEFGRLIIKETDKNHRGTNSNDNYAVPRLPLSMDRYFQTPDTLPEKEYHVFRNMFNKLHKQFPNAEKGTIYTTISYQYTGNAGEIKTSTYHFAFNNKKASKMFKDMIISKVGSLSNLKHVEVSETTVTPYTIKENTKIFAGENKEKSGPNYGGTIEQFKFEYALNKQIKLLEELRKLNQTFTKVDMADNLVARQLSGRESLLDGKNKMDLIAEKKVGFFKRKSIERKARKQIEKEYKERNEQLLNQSIASQNSELNNQSAISDPQLAAFIEEREMDLGIRSKKAKKEQKKAKKEQEKLKRKNKKEKNVQEPKTVEQPVQEQTTNSATKPAPSVQKTKQPEAVAKPVQEPKINKVPETKPTKSVEQEEHKVANKKVITKTEPEQPSIDIPPYNPPLVDTTARIKDEFDDMFVEGTVVEYDPKIPTDFNTKVKSPWDSAVVTAEVVDEKKEEQLYINNELKKIEEKLLLEQENNKLKEKIAKLQKSVAQNETTKKSSKKKVLSPKVENTVSAPTIQTATAAPDRTKKSNSTQSKTKTQTSGTKKPTDEMEP